MNIQTIKNVINFHAGQPATVADAEARLDFWASLPTPSRELVNFRNDVMAVVNNLWLDDVIDDELKSKTFLAVRSGAADYLLEGDATAAADAVMNAVTDY